VKDRNTYSIWLNCIALLTAACTLVLIFLGGMVTSKHAGMSVPDWPNSYGYNMFLFPPSRWAGGILFGTHAPVAGNDRRIFRHGADADGLGTGTEPRGGESGLLFFLRGSVG